MMLLKKIHSMEKLLKCQAVLGLFVLLLYFSFVVGIWKTKLGNHNVGVF